MADETEKQPVNELNIQDAVDFLIYEENTTKENLCDKEHCGAEKEESVNENDVAKETFCHELLPMCAPMLPLEQCIQSFLDGCDADNDEFITLQEWDFEITEEEIDKCDDVQDESSSL